MKLVTVLALLTACVQSAVAQDARLKERLDAESARRVQSLVDSAAALDLPTEPLIQKALEGASKRAAPHEIERVVRALVGALEDARAALGDGAEKREITAGAAAINAGVTAAQLQSLRPYRGEQAFASALIGCAFLRQRGMSAQAAVAIAHSMLEAKLTEADFVALQRLVEQDLRAGAAVSTAARVRSEALIQHGSIRRELQ